MSQPNELAQYRHGPPAVQPPPSLGRPDDPPTATGEIGFDLREANSQALLALTRRRYAVVLFGVSMGLLLIGVPVAILITAPERVYADPTKSATLLGLSLFLGLLPIGVAIYAAQLFTPNTAYLILQGSLVMLTDKRGRTITVDLLNPPPGFQLLDQTDSNPADAPTRWRIVSGNAVLDAYLFRPLPIRWTALSKDAFVAIVSQAERLGIRFEVNEKLGLVMRSLSRTGP